MPQLIGVLAPMGRDAKVIQTLLNQAGIPSLPAIDLDDMIRILRDQRAGAFIVTEEALNRSILSEVEDALVAQPSWSDFPFVLLTGRGTQQLRHAEYVTALGNVTVLERPFSPAILTSAARAALRARARQRDTETHILQIANRERELDRERARLQISETRLQEANEKLGQRFAASLKEKQVLADIVEGTDAFVQVADLQYRWLAINKASSDEFERIFGVRPKVGDSMLDLIAHIPAQHEAVRAVWGRALAGEEFTEVDEFGNAELDRRCYEMKFNTLRDEDGRRIGAYQFVYDVTERVRSQQLLEEAQARVHEMAKLETLGQLTGGVAHDFNNLLTPIVGALDILKRRPDNDARATRLIAGGLEAAERAAVLVQRLLTFARRQHLEARAINVSNLLEGMLELMQRTIGSHVEITLNPKLDLPAAKIDPNQLELAVLNLAVNAADAMPGGGSLTITVTEKHVALKSLGDLKPGPYILITVTDSGSGMDSETIRRAIEPFYTTKGVGKGTGLGLSMVHGLAAQSGGAFRLRSEVGKGTTAEIWLPATHVVPDLFEVSTADAVATAPAVVLLVDDEDLVRRGTAEMLREVGHTVLEASSGAQAIELTQSRPDIQCLVTDFLMPHMNGSELLTEIRRFRPNLPCLIITGYADAMAGDGVGAARLAKPFKAFDLAREIEAIRNDND